MTRWPRGEEKGQVGVVDVKQPQPAQIVGAVARQDREPGVEEVVVLFREMCIVSGEYLEAFRH